MRSGPMGRVHITRRSLWWSGAVAALLLTGYVLPGRGQAPEKAPTLDDLAKDNTLFLALARKAQRWDEPTAPVKIAGPLHFVGTQGLSSFLFATKEGHILLNTGMPGSGKLIVASIRQLGFRPEDIKVLINGHGHADHAGDFAYLKRLTGAQIAIMEPDVPMVEDGGRSDFHYGHDWQIMGQPPVDVDRVLRDGDTVRLGEVVLTAHWTPGHTRGATTWTTSVTDEGKAYAVVFVDGAGFNPGYRVSKDESYPGINADYRRTLHTLEMMRPDIFLGPHTEWFDLEGKRARAAREGVNAWIDPEGYRQWVADKRRAFEDQVDKEQGRVRK